MLPALDMCMEMQSESVYRLPDFCVNELFIIMILFCCCCCFFFSFFFVLFFISFVVFFSKLQTASIQDLSLRLGIVRFILSDREKNEMEKKRNTDQTNALVGLSYLFAYELNNVVTMMAESFYVVRCVFLFAYLFHYFNVSILFYFIFLSCI